MLLPTIQSVTFKDPGLGRLVDSVQPYLAFPEFSTWWESDAVAYVYGFGYLLLKPILTITVVATLLFMLATTMRWPAIVLALVILSHHTITAVFAEHYTRYVDQVLPLTVVLAAMGCIAAHRGYKQLM